MNYHAIRGGLITRGTTLAAWARKHRIPLRTAYNAAQGIRNGTATAKVRRQLEEAVL